MKAKSNAEAILNCFQLEEYGYVHSYIRVPWNLRQSLRPVFRWC